MEKFDIEPRKKLSSPISGLTDKGIVTPSIPDASFLCHNNRLTPTQLKFDNYKQFQLLSTRNQYNTLTRSINNNNNNNNNNENGNNDNRNCEIDKNNLKKLKPIAEHPTEGLLNKRENGNDLRFKFYQRLKESNNSIIPVDSSKITSNIEPIYKHISGHLQQIKSLSANKSQIPLNSPHKINNYNSNSKNDNQDNYNNLKLLLSLIQSQYQQIKSLKIQINALISIYEREKYNKEQIALLNSSKNNLKSTVNDKHITNTKTSIGVMTSLEFTLKKKPTESTNSVGIINLSSSPNNNVIESKIYSPMPFKVFTSNPEENSNYNNNVDDDNKSSNRDHDDNDDDDCLVIDNNNRSMANVPAKVGWTFYNNMMCQVNELLDTQNDNIQRQQKHHYQTQQSFINDKRQQRSMMQQWKIFKATMTTGLTDDKIISSDEMMNYDSSYYPKVNYQTNIVQTTNSILDNNTSIHMRALALKYLGHNSESTNLQALTKLMSVISTPMNDGNNNDKYINNIISDERCRQLLTLENPENSLFNYEGRKQNRQNVLDISVLKRQPKLL